MGIASTGFRHRVSSVQEETIGPSRTFGSDSTIVTHTFPLARVTEAYQLFGERREDVIKVAIKP